MPPFPDKRNSINELPDNLLSWKDEPFNSTVQHWHKFRHRVSKTDLAIILARYNRRMGVETGLLDGLYHFPPEVTEAIVNSGLEALDINQVSTPAETDRASVPKLIADQIDIIQDMVEEIKSKRALTQQFISGLHIELTRNQGFARSPLAKLKGLGGVLKKLTCGLKRTDGSIYEHFPLRQVQSEFDRLLKLFHKNQNLQMDPVVQAAWFHHSYIKISPFQTGNGRIARALTALILMGCLLPPLVITMDNKMDYLDALERANAGDLRALVYFFKVQLDNDIKKIMEVDIHSEFKKTAIFKDEKNQDLKNTEAIKTWLALDSQKTQQKPPRPLGKL